MLICVLIKILFKIYIYKNFIQFIFYLMYVNIFIKIKILFDINMCTFIKNLFNVYIHIYLQKFMHNKYFI